MAEVLESSPLPKLAARPAHHGDLALPVPFAHGGSSPQEPGLFEADVVMAQLRYSGLLETVRIRKEGFPVRLPFQAFVDR